MHHKIQAIHHSSTLRICSFLERAEISGVGLQNGTPGPLSPSGDRREPQSLGLNTRTVCTLSSFVVVPCKWRSALESPAACRLWFLEGLVDQNHVTSSLCWLAVATCYLWYSKYSFIGRAVFNKVLVKAVDHSKH